MLVLLLLLLLFLNDDDVIVTAAKPTYVKPSFNEKPVLYASLHSPVLFLYRCNFKIVRQRYL